MYTGDTPGVWPIHFMSSNPIGHFKMNNYVHLTFIEFDVVQGSHIMYIECTLQ